MNGFKEGDPCSQCEKGFYEWSKYCGALVCCNCNDHAGLCKCYCGWGLAHGERLEDDIGEGHFDGEQWDMEY